MPQPNRNFDGQEYRYGFQGQEKDSELKGEGLSVNYKYRMHDPRLGRFFAVDPITAEYPWNSAYAFSENRVVDGLELEGQEYIEYNIFLNEDGSFLKREVAEDFRGMGLKEIHDIHGMTPSHFYSTYSESFGPDGRGIKYSFYRKNRTLGLFFYAGTTWDQRQDTPANKLQYHGNFQGSGAATLTGVPGNSKVSSFFPNAYDFSLNPIDTPDLLAKMHDESQDGLEGYINPLDDVRDVVFNGDMEFMKGHLEYQKNVMLGGGSYLAPRTSFVDPITNKPASREAVQTSFEATFLFDAIISFKEWKRNTMKDLGLNVNNPQHMKDERLTLDKWTNGTRLQKVKLELAFGERRLKSNDDE